MIHVLSRKAFLTIPVLLFFTISNLFAQSLYVKYGDNYLKGKDGFEKNVVKAAECFQRAADVGDERGIKRLKKMGLNGEEWTPCASLFNDRFSGKKFPDEVPDNVLYLVSWGKGKDYIEAMKVAMEGIRNECNTEIGESCTLKAYHLLGALETKEWTRVAVQTIFEVPNGSTSGSSFKIGPKKNVSDFRFKNAVNSMNTFFEAMHEYLPFVLKVSIKVNKTLGPFITGNIEVGYKDYSWTSLLRIIPAIAFSKEETHRYANKGFIYTDGEDFFNKHFYLPKESFSMRHNSSFDFTNSSGKSISRTNIWACLPTQVIVTEASLKKVTSLKVEGMVELDHTNRVVHFNMNKDIVAYTKFKLDYTWEQFNKVDEVEIKSEDELNFGQQLMLLEEFLGDWNNSDTFLSLLNKYKRQNADYPERLQALKKIEDIADCEIRGRLSMNEGLRIRYGYYGDDDDKNLSVWEGIFSTVSGRNKAEIKKNVVTACSRLLEMCNEAILYFDEAKQSFQQCYRMIPKPYLKELIDKCEKELNGENGLNDKKQYWSLLLKEAKSKK